jgi:hypothetical protein
MICRKCCSNKQRSCYLLFRYNRVHFRIPFFRSEVDSDSASADNVRRLILVSQISLIKEVISNELMNQFQTLTKINQQNCNNSQFNSGYISDTVSLLIRTSV